MTQTWRATEKAQRRAQYLRAAGHLFALRGYRAVTIDELGAAVGVSGPALYRHFASKEAMLSELLVSASERLLAGFSLITERGAPDLETIRDLIAFHVDFALAERDVIRMQERELANLPEESNHRVRLLQRLYIQGWSEIVSRLRPDTPAPELEVKMHALFGILNSTPYSARLDGIADTRTVLVATATLALLGETHPTAT